ncbi:hypothetical protein GCM10025876_28090 [Demequina litorisediminis]|uniref:FMN-dependent dehydrogenase domain-containing protein n=1 Tax=Demequina litorisediminis TaxID=1849022 RepID=A0ABQ6IFQ8_9MICO|nr:hypothetical protein GCM10025876_28090 [Demequina litorisediminis]
MQKDRDKSMGLVSRAADAGFDTLLVTVDVPVAGARLRDSYNGFTIPPQAHAADGAQRDPAARVVVELPHHRAARVRLALGVEWDHRRACSMHSSTPPSTSTISHGFATSGRARWS